MSILSIDSIVNEINVIQDHCADITQFIDEANDYLNNAYLTEEQYAFAVQKDDKELCEKINAALKTLKENGKFTEIVNKYYSD